MLSLIAIASVASLLLAACGSTPAAPPLTDPKDILTKTVLSLKDVKTVEMTGSFTGTLTVKEMGGSLDLTTTKLSAALDIPNKKAKFNLDAPSILGTKVDAVLLDNIGYLKISGIFAGMIGLTPDKWTKEALPVSSAAPSASADASEVADAIKQINEALDKLPTPPTKGADEACGDQQCYHVTIKVTSDQLKSLDPSVGNTVSGTGDVAVDVWSRKNDVRPAKVSFTITSPEIGTVGIILEFKYDGSVSVEAPPADQIAP
jgi:hypothetical protein